MVALMLLLGVHFSLWFVTDVTSFSIRENVMPQLQVRQFSLQRGTISLYSGEKFVMNARKTDVVMRSKGNEEELYIQQQTLPQSTTPIIETNKRHWNLDRRYVLSFIGSTFVAAATLATSTTPTNVVNAAEVFGDTNDDGTNLTTQLFNPDGSLKDTELVVEAQERTVQLQPTTAAPAVWVDAVPSSSSSSNNRHITETSTTVTATYPTLKYNIPMKWDQDYIDSTTKERACSRIYAYRIPYPNDSNTGNDSIDSTNDSETTKKTKRRMISSMNSSSSNINSSSTASNRRLQVSDILNALPADDVIRQSLRNADIMGGNVRRPTTTTRIRNDGGSNDSNDTAKTDNNHVYSEFDLAVAPTTCSGGENEDLRLGFCPYDRIFLISATTTYDLPFASNRTSQSSELSVMNQEDNLNSRTASDGISNRPSDYLSVLIVESTRSEWQRANADLRRVRGSFVVS
jgi:hypothetical protein